MHCISIGQGYIYSVKNGNNTVEKAELFSKYFLPDLTGRASQPAYG